MKKFIFRSASSAAILVGLAGAFPAWAQQTAPQPPVDRVTPGEPAAVAPERVIVTGSLIAGSAEDAALPVEVFSQADLEEQGSPSALDFAKSLTTSGPMTGEANAFGGVGSTGNVQYNLRGIGADKTLTLLNGRRGSQNASNIPAVALARVEVLKDGAAVIYGADAAGGVVNFITRDHFVGLEARGNYKYIADSDGDYGLSLLGGIGDGDTNFLWSVEWEHRSRLETEDRDFSSASFDYSVNPSPWSTLTNLAAWTPRGALPASPSVANEFGGALGSAIGDFTKSSCEAIGGYYSSATSCRMNYASFYNLVETNDIYRAYAQLNTHVTDHMDFHVEASYGQVISPEVFNSPVGPVLKGPAMASGLTNQFYVPTTNPYAAAFAASHGAPVGTAGFTPGSFRAIGFGGNALAGLDGHGFGAPGQVDNQVWKVSAGLKGEFGDWAGIARDVGYDVAVTYNQSISYQGVPDLINYRLQEAMNGFGGPNCSVVDLDPNRFGTQNPAAAGKNGCLWWNPFATNFAEQPERHLPNPQYVAGQENPIELLRWMWDERTAETIVGNLTLDAAFNGKSGIKLPGGEIGWALGAQGRQTESRQVVDGDFYNGNTPCQWPTNFTSQNGAGSLTLPQLPVSTSDATYRGCTPDRPGPYSYNNINPPTYADQQQYSIFGELHVPVLDNLNLQLAARREEFSGGLGATVYKVSGKWDVWGPLSVRGSYGTNYQAPPIGLVPGRITNGNTSYAVAGSTWLGSQVVTDAGITPETATSWNTGIIWQSDGFAPGHDLRIIVDYFNIETQDEIGQLAELNKIANLVFNGGTSSNGTITTCDPNVQPLLNRVTLNSTCTIGMSAVTGLASVQTVLGNGPGQSTAGIDYQVSYKMPAGPGDLSLDFTATQVTKLFTGPTTLDGVSITTGDDRLGTLNFGTLASAAPEWRAHLTANYKLDRHNFRLGYNYVSAVTDERPGIQWGENGETWQTWDFTYLFDITDGLRLSASVNNIADRDPPHAQIELGYDARLASPLGRTIELGLKKAF
jgi:iron complex outermembrane recepter protein